MYAEGQQACTSYGGGGGGAVYLSSGYSPFSVSVSGSTFSGGSATDGAAMFVFGLVTVSVRTSTFVNNSALNRGGVLFMQSSTSYAQVTPTTAVITSSVLSNNSAGSSGGVAFVYQGTNLTSSNSVYNSNTAASGGVFSLATDPTKWAVPYALLLSNITAAGNAATSGAFTYHNDRTPLRVACAGCTLSGNTQANAGAVPTYFNASAALLSSPSGRLLPTLNVTLFDADGNVVNTWQDLVVTISAGSFTGLSGTTSASYSAGAASFSTLVASDVVGARRVLTYTLSSPTLTALGSLTNTNPTGTVTVVVQPCASTEVFDNTTLRCRCAVGSFLNATSAQCQTCGYGYVSTTTGAVACDLCLRALRGRAPPPAWRARPTVPGRPPTRACAPACPASSTR